MPDATIDLYGMPLTLTGAVPDPVTGNVDDVYNEGMLYAIRSAMKYGTDMNNIMDQVQRYSGDLTAVNSLSTWQASDWDNQTAAVQRTQALVDLGVVQKPGNGDGQAVDANVANTIYVTPSSQSGLPAGMKLTWAPSSLTNIAYPGDGNQVGGYTGPIPALAIGFNTSPSTYFVIDSNNQAWKVDRPFGQTPTTSQLAYQPTDAEIAGYQPNRQSWTTTLGQMSTDSQLILQTTTTSYTQAWNVASNISQAKAQSKAGVAANFY
jgi:hypothetical protein